MRHSKWALRKGQSAVELSRVSNHVGVNGKKKKKKNKKK